MFISMWSIAVLVLVAVWYHRKNTRQLLEIRTLSESLESEKFKNAELIESLNQKESLLRRHQKAETRINELCWKHSEGGKTDEESAERVKMRDDIENAFEYAYNGQDVIDPFNKKAPWEE